MTTTDIAAPIPPAAIDNTRPKRIVLALIAVLSVVDGWAAEHFYPGWEQAPSAMWFLLPYMLLIFAWFRFDTDERGYRRTPWLNAAVIAVAALGLSYYFFRSRGFKRGLIAVLLALAFLVTMGLANIAGMYLA